jgi:hypothetical protein
MVGRRGTLVAGLLVGALLLSDVAHAAGERCAAAKLRAAGRKAASKISCYRKAVLAGTAPDADCLARAEAKFVRALAAADVRGGCLTTGDAADVEAIVDQFIADLVAHFPNTTTSSTTTTSSSSSSSFASPPPTLDCGSGSMCSNGSPCGEPGYVCQFVPSCFCGGPSFCTCWNTTFTTCTSLPCSSTSTSLP